MRPNIEKIEQLCQAVAPAVTGACGAERLQDSILAGERPFADVVFEAIEAAGDRGIELAPRFAFGALKGLIVLAGSDYVGPKEFADLLAKEVRAMMIRKAPALILERLSGD